MSQPILLLDLGLYGGAERLVEALKTGNGATPLLLDLKNTEELEDKHWDEVMEQLQRAEHCITL